MRFGTLIRSTLLLGIGLLTAGRADAQLSQRPDDLLHDGFEGAAAGPFSDGDAARFLTQSTFGPTLADIQHVRLVGYSAWLDEQFAAATSLELPYVFWVDGVIPTGAYQQQRLESWFINSLGTSDPSNPLLEHRDQLRQRVAMALSEIFVVSDRNATLEHNAYALASYYDVLARNALGSFRTLLEETTLHPAMGVYLNMLGNRKPDAIANIRPDENFAREVLQLFSVGLVQLNTNGTRQLNNGQPIPTYNQNTVRGFAHVFTGWNFAGCGIDDFDNCGPGNGYDPEWMQPMQAVEAFHDQANSKQLLNYSGVALSNGLLPAGGSAQADMSAALDNIFQHPNVGPFIAFRLIQRLVTSNPTPAYVERVALKFNNNGLGVRGDLKAVVKAILLDPEARYGHWQAPQTFGKLREPMLRLTHMWRAMNAGSTIGRLQMSDPADYYGQAPLRSPSVFNFFRPDYQLPGEIRNAGLFSPEFQISTDTFVVSGPNDLDWRIFYFYYGSDYAYALEPGAILMDLARDAPLAATPAALIDKYNLLFLSGQMSPFMRQVLITRLNAMPNDNGGRDRVQHALYLILTSPEYAIQK